MPKQSPRAAGDEWRDAQGTPIALRSRVEQIAVDPAHGVLPARLHRQGQVIGWGAGLLYVIFDHERETATLPPHFIRVLHQTPDGD